METQINASLISLHKIAKYTATTRIDTTSGDCDEYISSPVADIYRAVFDSRVKARDMLLSKYRAVKEHIKYIITSRDAQLQSYLPQIRKQLEASRAGLTLYKSNLRYANDGKITSTVDHLLDEEIPGQMAQIDTHLNAVNIAASLLPADM